MVWDYKVIAGTYELDGAELVIENPLGKGTLQRVLDHYGGEGVALGCGAELDRLDTETQGLILALKGINEDMIHWDTLEEEQQQLREYLT